jgi:hypothetical protein
MRWNNEGVILNPTVRRVCHVAVLVVVLAAVAKASYAAPYDRADVFDAMQSASVDTGVSYDVLYYIVGCETGWTFNPNSEGDHGHSHGAAQLNDYGNALPVFYAEYTNPYNPYEAIYFMAETLRGDHRPLGRHTWSC